jgi:hypothetical protein
MFSSAISFSPVSLVKNSMVLYTFCRAHKTWIRLTQRSVRAASNWYDMPMRLSIVKRNNDRHSWVTTCSMANETPFRRGRTLPNRLSQDTMSETKRQAILGIGVTNLTSITPIKKIERVSLKVVSPKDTPGGDCPHVKKLAGTIISRHLNNCLSPSHRVAKSLLLNHFATWRLAKPSLWDLRE